MSINDTYQTIAGTSEGLYKEKGSKFLAYAFPCSNEDDVKNHLEALKTQHSKARHFCYAYRLGTEGAHTRANDDGEPSGSAGIPILGQLQSFNLTQALVVVVRYFGGIKLGVGGLVRAYKTAAEEALTNSQIVEIKLMQHYLLTFDYGIYSDLLIICRQLQIEISHHQLEENCSINIILSQASIANFMAKLEGMKIEVEDLGFY